MNKKIILLGSLLVCNLLFLLIFSSTSYASGIDCQTVYGSNDCPPETFTLKKTVQKPGTSDYVDTLEVTDPHYLPNQQVSFQISVTNKSGKKLTDLQVIDTLPTYLSYVSGGKSYNQNTREISYTIDALNPNETKKQTLITKLSEEKLLPSDQSLLCMQNNVKASISSGMSKTDSTQLCVEKQITTKGGIPIYTVQNVSATPSTGANIFSLMYLLPISLSGLVLRKRSNQHNSENLFKDISITKKLS